MVWSKAITRYLHHFSDKFRFVTDLRVCLLEELSDDLPGTIDFDVGCLVTESRSSKLLVVTSNDLNCMNILRLKKIFSCGVMLSAMVEIEVQPWIPKARSRGENQVSKDDVDAIIRRNTVSTLCLNLGCAQGWFTAVLMMDNPPAVPMFSSTQSGKRGSLVVTTAESVAIFSKAFVSYSPAQSSTSSPTLELSHGKKYWSQNEKSSTITIYSTIVWGQHFVWDWFFLEQKNKSLRKWNQWTLIILLLATEQN